MDIQNKNAFLLKISPILLAPAILYWQDLALVANEALNSDLATHILAIPFLLAYILYRKRRIITASISNILKFTRNSQLPPEEISGVLLCLLAYIIKWFGSYTFQPLEYHLTSLPIFTAGLILIVFNAQTLRTVLFPLAFLAFLIPPSIEMAQQAGATLAAFSSQAAYTLLKTMGIQASLSSLNGNPIIRFQTSTGELIPFAIDIACSGLYSLVGFALFAVFTAYIARSPLPKKLLILILGFPLICSLNVLRITVIVLVGYFFGAGIALNAFHLLGGWVFILVGTLILLTVAEKAFKINIFSTTSKACTHPKKNEDERICKNCGQILKLYDAQLSKRDTVKLSLIFVIAISLLFIQVPVFTLTEGAAEILIQKPTEEFKMSALPEIEDYELWFLYRDIEFEEISGQDAALQYKYNPKDTTNSTIYASLEIGPTKACLHSWEVCLITWPQTRGYEVGVTQLDLREIHLLENPPLTAKYFAFQGKNSDKTQVILYWYTRSTFKTEEGYQTKYTKISLIEFTYKPQEYGAIEDELLPVAKSIANYWKPIEEWSWLALFLARDSPTLMAATGALLLGVTLYYLYLKRIRRRRALYVYNKISDSEDLKILDALGTLEKSPVTISDIASKYKDNTGKDINQEMLHLKLIKAEERGIVERKIININDEPYITWKLNII
jgi:exosortase